MIEKVFLIIVKLLLKIRYRIEVTGLENIEGAEKVLFLPNHPAFIDPLIVMSIIFGKFRPRPLSDKARVEKPVIKTVMKRINPVLIPDLGRAGREAHKATLEAMNNIATSLENGDNVIMYPSGRLYRENRESVRGNSGAHHVINAVPDAKVVLVRTNGLWGSSFSWATGKNPELFRCLPRYLLAIICGLLFFVPKRKVSVEFVVPEDLPYGDDKMELNRYLDNFYNEKPEESIVLPYYLWGGSPIAVEKKNVAKKTQQDLGHIAQSTKDLVNDKLKELTGVAKIGEGDHLSKDLGLDSLTMVELQTWIEGEFGITIENQESIQTVAHCYLAANGQLLGDASALLTPPTQKWQSAASDNPLKLGGGSNIAEIFLANAAANKNQPLLVDQLAGEKTYQDIILGVFVLKRIIEKIDADYIGIMLPASVSATVVYLATLFSGKVPVMINWTVGKGNMLSCLETVGVEHIFTASALVEKIKYQGFDYSDISAEWIMLDKVAAKISVKEKIAALIKSKFSWKELRNAKIPQTAAVLFTSGSEAKPKAVPLTHANFIANMSDYSKLFDFKQSDCLLGMLPPFHSFGLASGVVLPLAMGMKVVYHSNPTEGAVLSKIIGIFRPTLLLGTPTFLQGILSAAGDLQSLRIVISGAEKCPDHIFDAFAKQCPQATLCEGYGITECSPVVSANTPGCINRGSIGKVMPSMEYVIVNEDGDKKCLIGERGRLLLRGGNIFSGYLNYEGKSPFVEFDGKDWYDTGDLVTESDDGILTFAGRLKRFVKLGGEMISLPAIEAVLAEKYPANEGEPQLAIEAAEGDNQPEIILIATCEISREEANRIIKDAGLSGLHNIRKIKKVDEIPLLGTGKTDYRSLKRMIN
ncbi:MAG: hypothetical protein D6B27_11825 [Gammaproteobacteria bacterium]|mgnify:CR=1 FL=1|nr:MAG: hypothetical protein D6B27_11825 [Gammaproteobacteria bacterium]